MTDAPPITGLHHVTNICTDTEQSRTYCTSLSVTELDELTFEIATERPGFGVDESRRLSSANQNSPSSGDVGEAAPRSEVIGPYEEGSAQAR